MKTENIISEVIRKVQENFGNAYEVSSQEVIKNNNSVNTGVSIRNKTGNIGAIVYITDLLNSGAETDAIVEYVLDNFEADISTDVQFLANNMHEYEAIKPHLELVLVNKRMNGKRFQNVPFKEFLDLAMIVKAGMPEYSVTINDDILKLWSTDFDEVFRAAEENFQKKETIVTDMNTLSRKLGGRDISEDRDAGLYVLSNIENREGAIRILDDAAIRKFAEEHHAEKIVILPSSIHEVLLLIPDREITGEDITTINKAIQEINQTVLRPKDILSDHCYIWSKDGGITYIEEEK